MNMMEWMVVGGIVVQHYEWPRPGGGSEIALVMERDGRRAMLLIPVHREAGSSVMVRSCGPVAFIRLHDCKVGDEWLRFRDPVPMTNMTLDANTSLPHVPRG